MLTRDHNEFNVLKHNAQICLVPGFAAGAWVSLLLKIITLFSHLVCLIYRVVGGNGLEGRSVYSYFIFLSLVFSTVLSSY